MENASKALIMAGGILLGLLILTLIIVLFMSSSELTSKYQETKLSEEVQQFNVNFTKYLGKNLTIHEAITITNFAKQNDVDMGGTEKYISDINKNEIYTIKILSYDSNGYIDKIQIN